MVTMKKKIDGELQIRRIHMYSGHDSSIIPLMVALGVPRLDVPLVMPGSALLLELHEDTLTRKHSIKVQSQHIAYKHSFPIITLLIQRFITQYLLSLNCVSSQAISEPNPPIS